MFLHVSIVNSFLYAYEPREVAVVPILKCPLRHYIREPDGSWGSLSQLVFVFLTISSMTLTLKIHSAVQELSSTPSSWVVTWPRPGPILLAQSEVFPGINTWRLGGRCYLLSQEWLGCGCLWLCSLPCGHNPANLENAIQSPKQSQDWGRRELQQENESSSRIHEARVPTALPLFLGATLTISLWIPFLGYIIWDWFLLFVTKRGLTTITPYKRSESDAAAAAAKSLQSCLTLRDPRDSSVMRQTIKYLWGSEETSFSLWRLELQRMEKEKQKKFSRVLGNNKNQHLCRALQFSKDFHDHFLIWPSQ